MNQEVTWIDPEDDLLEPSDDVSFTEYDIPYILTSSCITATHIRRLR